MNTFKTIIVFYTFQNILSQGRRWERKLPNHVTSTNECLFLVFNPQERFRLLYLMSFLLSCYTQWVFQNFQWMPLPIVFKFLNIKASLVDVSHLKTFLVTDVSQYRSLDERTPSQYKLRMYFSSWLHRSILICTAGTCWTQLKNIFIKRTLAVDQLFFSFDSSLLILTADIKMAEI